jgi:hypothetical protein
MPLRPLLRPGRPGRVRGRGGSVRRSSCGGAPCCRTRRSSWPRPGGLGPWSRSGVYAGTRTPSWRRSFSRRRCPGRTRPGDCRASESNAGIWDVSRTVHDLPGPESAVVGPVVSMSKACDFQRGAMRWVACASIGDHHLSSLGRDRPSAGRERSLRGRWPRRAVGWAPVGGLQVYDARLVWLVVDVTVVLGLVSGSEVPCQG